MLTPCQTCHQHRLLLLMLAIQAVIFGEASIYGRFTRDEAVSLATALENPLEQPLEIVTLKPVFGLRLPGEQPSLDHRPDLRSKNLLFSSLGK